MLDYRSVPGAYALATGRAAAHRLGMLHGLYEACSRLLREAGLWPGKRAADLGCGVGLVTGLIVELVGPWGHVVGIDASAQRTLVGHLCRRPRLGRGVAAVSKK
jgi:SAM-dependent methyltransferase